MSLTTSDLAALTPASGGSRPDPAWQLGRWLRQRRQAAVLRLVEPRLREDAGLPGWPAAAPRLTRLMLLGGG